LTVHVETFTNTSSFIAKGDTFSVEKFKNQQKRSTKILKHHILPYFAISRKRKATEFQLTYPTNKYK